MCDTHPRDGSQVANIPPQMLESLSPALRDRVVVTGFLWLWEVCGAL